MYLFIRCPVPSGSGTSSTRRAPPGEESMIQLTKLDDRRILVSLETVKYVESVPDTLIFFLNGDTVMVKESLEDVIKAVETFKTNILGGSRA